MNATCSRGGAVAVVNEVFARTYFANENPIGRRFVLSISTPVDLEIIGVSRTARYDSLKGDIPPVVYIPYSLKFRPLGQMTFELRAAGRSARARSGRAPGAAAGRSRVSRFQTS